MKTRNIVLCACTALGIAGGLCLTARRHARPAVPSKQPVPPPCWTLDAVPRPARGEALAVNRDGGSGAGVECSMSNLSLLSTLSSLPLPEVCVRLRNALLAADHRAVAACRKQLLRLGEEAVDPLTRLVNHGNPEVEIEALRLLTQIGTERSLAVALGRVLTLHPATPRFEEFLAVFGNCRNPAVADWLVAFLGRTDRAYARDRALQILKHLRGSAVVASLAHPFELGTATDEIHAADCVAALAGLSAPSHVDMLQAVFDASTSDEIRLASALALANVGNAAACEFLVSAAADGNDGAAFALRAIPTITSTYAQEALLGVARDRALPGNLRVAAVAALANHDSTRVRTVLRNLASDEPHAGVDTAIQETLAAIAVPSRVAGTDAGSANLNEDEVWF